ncbi:MAG: FAD-dependent monooxygenase [Aquabacterium sp.]|uniref:NAD(P)/FAD-dependent oxidoreductase n=1 Tax=Aquabacterium sp. TaxID=1872578 RepID=UPI0012240436|nr:NAD(P)/FAD-dependent oxidoreductase [Aquabacterium sp.]TAK92778.1 MAG: FAD-dependent monooxygenase [Aquabacterium sp.]
MYDAIVVGGRCGGAATALLLARQGHKVLIVDQATLPSDVRLSTHLIWHAGVDLLHEWGLLEAVQETGCPLLTGFSLDLGELALRGQPPGSTVGAAMAPRRLALDKVLLDAALAAGVELRQGVTFEDVLKDGDRVTGIRGRLQDGSAFTAHAKVVVGADGTHSRVARAVGADTYNESPKEAGSFNLYSYFTGVKLDGVEFFSRPERMIYAWETNDGRSVIGVIQPGGAPRPARDNMEAHFQSELAALAPGLASRVQNGRRDDEWLSGAIATFCRQAAGPGWCLVGDAGVTMDPITAAGISNALRDADLAAALIHEGLQAGHSLDDSLANYQARRDAVSVPLLQFAQEMAKLAPPTEDVFKLFMALASNQEQIDNYYGVFGQTVTPMAFFDPANMAKIFAAA